MITGGAIIYTDWIMYFLILPQALYVLEFASCTLSLISQVSLSFNSHNLLMVIA